MRTIVQGRILQTTVIRHYTKKIYQHSIPSICLELANRHIISSNNKKIDRTVKQSSFHTASLICNEKKNVNIPPSKNSTNRENAHDSKTQQPQLMIAFTCKKCNTRSSHTMSKQAYTKGTVLIQCPGCKNRHLIADHLKIFNDHSINIEDILRAKGENVSQSTEDLVLEDIPEKLKPILSKYITNGENAKTNGNKD